MRALFMATLVSACGGSDESEQWTRQDGWNLVEVQEAERVAPRPGPRPGRAARSSGTSWQSGQPPALRAQRLQPLPRPPWPRLSRRKWSREVEVESVSETPAQLVSQRRIIVRTANMVIVVDDIQAAIDDISRMADTLGGWVGLHRPQPQTRRKYQRKSARGWPRPRHRGTARTGGRTSRPKSLPARTSPTNEYYDLQSRLKNQQATEAALIRLLDRAENVEHALAVQRELSNVQENVERLLGRIKLLEETSAFSLITVSLRLAPVSMAVGAGPDQSVAVHSPTRFKATFTPPEGMDEHNIVWDFGDGSEPVYIRRTAPTTEEGERVTATVTHIYDDPRDSPFIAQVTIDSFGEKRSG